MKNRLRILYILLGIGIVMILVGIILLFVTAK